MTRVSGLSGPGLAAAVLGVLPELLPQWLPGGEQRGHLYIALNPKRDDRNLGSFQIDLRSGQWKDHAIGRGGRDLVSLYAYLSTGDDYRRAAKLLATHPIIRAAVACGAAVPAAKPAKAATTPGVRIALAQRIYTAASELPGSPAQTYLESRGLQPTEAWGGLRASMLQYPRRGRHPALVAPITSTEGALVGVHRTFLRPNGTKLDVTPVRLVLGQVLGCAIKLGEPDDRLIICEGLEDGLTLYQELDGHPVWVSAGASLMAAMIMPDRVRHLTIAADNDPAGDVGAQNAAYTHSVNGRDVRIMRPRANFKDFNDQLQGADHGR